MRPDLTRAPMGALIIGAVAFYVVIGSSSWPVIVAAGAVSLVTLWIVLRAAGPVVGHAPAMTRGEPAGPGSVTLIDDDGVPHLSLPYQDIVRVQIIAADGTVATCSKLPPTPYPLRRAELVVDGSPAHLERRGARRIDVMSDSGELIVTLERAEHGKASRNVKATAANGERLQEAPVERWTSPDYRPTGRAGAVAQATVLAGLGDQLRPLFSRLASSL